MDYSFVLWSTASYIETRLKEPIEYAELEKAVGFSYRHIREVFKECTGISLSRYILLRRIANTAFEIVHTSKSLTQIAADYMFISYDTFTRAYKRHIGHTPSELRSGVYPVKVGRQRIIIGLYAPVIIKNEKQAASAKEDWFQKSADAPPDFMEGGIFIKNMEKTNQSCILYGVPRVTYSFEEATPFCVALKACLNYMGQQIDYCYIMAATGAAFRLRWNTKYWDGGNVDIRNIYEDTYEPFKRGFQAAGRSFQILKREDSDKEGFIRFIKAEIDEGRPVIALGIIGPPEACLITGYRGDGAVLLGWNCFQENQEYTKNVSLDEAGYFITDAWWENEATAAVMSVGEKQEQPESCKQLLTNALDLLTRQSVAFSSEDHKVLAEYAGGQRAYELWAKCIADDKEFSKDTVIPLLFERLMCQNDAQTMVGEGRSYAACFLEWIGREREELAGQCKQAAQYFRRAAECTFHMNDCKGGFMQDEEAVRRFAEPEIRKRIVRLIEQARDYEARAAALVKDIVEAL